VEVLIVTSEDCPDLSWLSDLPPDAVSGLSVYADVDDAALAAVEHLTGLTQITISSKAPTGPHWPPAARRASRSTECSWPPRLSRPASPPCLG
jgi:hypothetical protein